MRRFGFLLFALLVSAVVASTGARVAYATHGDAHATITYWDLVAGPGASGFNGFDPHEQLADVPGQTNQLPDSTPTMVTAMENACGGFCAIMFWNPDTNDFETICVTGGLDFAVDVNRSSTLGGGTPGSFGGGDAWSAVFGNRGFSPYVVYRGNDTMFSRFDTANDTATGIRVNPSNGKIYIGESGLSRFSPIPVSPGKIVELDPTTNAVRKWTIGNHPYFLAINGSGQVYATAVAGGGHPDQIVRLDPATGVVTRWNVPGAMNFTPIVGEGNPNYISVDTTNSRRLWFSETESQEVARLDTSANTITEWTKPGIEHPMAINNAGPQAFFTEAGNFALDPGHVSVLNVNVSTIGVTTAAPPTTATVAPVTSTATRVDQAPFLVQRANITPSVFDSPGVDPSGITRFPIPPGTNRPTGMTSVWRPQTVSGSMEGTHHVFTLQSALIITCELTLSPASASNPVGTPHTVTATVTCGGEPQPGVVVTFTVMGTGSTPTPPAGTCVTGPDGTCTFTYTSPTPGSDVITATATTPGGQELMATATKTWTAVTEEPTPGKVTAGGKIDETTGAVIIPAEILVANGPDAGAKATFGGVAELRAIAAAVKGEWQHTGHGTGTKIHVKKWDTLVIEDMSDKCPLNPEGKKATMRGSGTVNGVPTSDIEVEVHDCGEPGSQQPTVPLPTGPDHYRITAGAYEASGFLIGGNVQIHKEP